MMRMYFLVEQKKMLSGIGQFMYPNVLSVECSIRNHYKVFPEEEEEKKLQQQK
jgi:hypothetical protein